MSKHFLVLFGTRPEAIKLFPVINRLKLEPGVQVTVCVTAQHRQMLDQVLNLTNIVPDVDLDLMEPGQTLDKLSAKILLSLGDVLDRLRPDCVVLQGDTATTMVGALASYYRKVPVAHVEAGLRSGDIYSPWPEEVNRRIVTVIAAHHFAPTERAAAALRHENISNDRIHVTGNTGIDALLSIKAMIDADPTLASRWDHMKDRHQGRRIILVTTHRRENFGGGMDRIGDALLAILRRPDIAVVLPMHPNPNVEGALRSRLAGNNQIDIIAPQEYLDFVGLLSLCDLVLTDSGGIQEEAPTFGKPVLVMRDTTERPEGVLAGTARLVGSNSEVIVTETFKLLDDSQHYREMSQAHNPFGDGKASGRIVKALMND
jgi:UDP-N-acetylglucosamine 2-epimerase (non-hydrolysing)